MNKTKLSFSQRLLLATTLFGMFFGAGNLIFPVFLGQLAGRNIIMATIGFCITAVGIPLLGVAAIGNTHSSNLQELSEKVSKPYSIFFTCLLYLTIGPFFAIPRCATVSFTTGVAPLFAGANEKIALFIFSLIFFALVLFFSLKPQKITVWIGKIINPLFLLFLFILITVVLTKSTVSINTLNPEAAYESGAFFSSFIEGYGTMDAIAGLAFGIVVIDIIRSWGISNDSDTAKEVIKSGIITATMMAVIYILIIIVGAKSKGDFGLLENGGVALREISKLYLGPIGSIVLALTITFACLKTSIGLVTSCGEAFERMFKSKISYKAWAIGITIFAFLVSNVGLSRIIEYSIPALMFIYPLTITLIILALVGNLFDHSKYVYQTVTVFTFIAALFDLFKTLPNSMIDKFNLNIFINFADKFLPFYGMNLGWVVPAIIGLAIGLLIKKQRS
ncbi:MAG: branched-chain amino acid transport system II carrier protein [Erysipelotrichaceae bacterium]|nr:branched-chain amino acid transport system II carrier protein [Erysipelotrichaceae bacterium]